MESTTILMEGEEWKAFNRVSVNEEADFMAKLFSNSSFSSDPEMSSLTLSSSFYSGYETSIGIADGDNCSFYTNESESNFYSLSSTSLSGSSDQCRENYCLNENSDVFFAVNNGSSLPIEFCLDTKGVVQVFPGNLMDRNHSLSLEMSCDNLDDPEVELTQHGNLMDCKMREISEIEPAVDDGKCNYPSEIGRKRSRKPEVKKGKSNTRAKRNRKNVVDEDDNGLVLNNQNLGNCSSDELSGENSNEPNVKTRAGRGSATDPQSLYARKRRERINERLRILQSLVPNGTKVDLSTMLEEAVQYVKFLQLQIKLLSSDDLWMYAPLAYNGMDIGLDAKLNSLL
ncbi:hypothetical protein RND81_08G017400 [Saponaria officinalis]|uniref:BHLH domain-containing protein n=1 Tax=Saponaria officinalis TaxID=3572 RepID=A0AAW1J244_SAPOF